MTGGHGEVHEQWGTPPEEAAPVRGRVAPVLCGAA